MHELIGREITDTVKTRLKNYPAVALLGARQVGKSTIAGMVIEQIPGGGELSHRRPCDGYAAPCFCEYRLYRLERLER